MERNESTWMDIETAPKDGTKILAIEEGCMTVAAFHDFTKNGEGADWFDVPFGCEDGGYVFSPTHWMPLPEPPEDVTAEMQSQIKSRNDLARDMKASGVDDPLVNELASRMIKSMSDDPISMSDDPILARYT